MGLDDGLADRKPDADAVGFCREEGLEQPADRLHLDAGAGIAYGDTDLPRSFAAGRDTQMPQAGVARAQGIYRVGQQIEQHLLQLDAITQNSGQLRIQLSLRRDRLQHKLAAQQVQGIENEIVDLEHAPVTIRPLEQRADALNHSARPRAVIRDVGQRFPGLRHIRRVGDQEATSRVGVAANGRQGLIELVRQGGGELAGGGDSPHMSQVVPQLLRLHFRILAPRHIPVAAAHPLNLPLAPDDRLAEVVNPAHLPVLSMNPERDRAVPRLGHGFTTVLLPAVPVLGMNHLGHQIRVGDQLCGPITGNPFAGG